jgi:hypothetical protein
MCCWPKCEQNYVTRSRYEQGADHRAQLWFLTWKMKNESSDGNYWKFNISPIFGIKIMKAWTTKALWVSCKRSTWRRLKWTKPQELQNEVCMCSCLTNLKGMVYTILEPLFKSKWASIVPTNNLDLYLGCVSHFENSNWIILNFFSTYNNLDMYLKYVQRFENSNWILFNLLCFDNNLHMGLCFVWHFENSKWIVLKVFCTCNNMTCI